MWQAETQCMVRPNNMIVAVRVLSLQGSKRLCRGWTGAQRRGSSWMRTWDELPGPSYPEPPLRE